MPFIAVPPENNSKDDPDDPVFCFFFLFFFDSVFFFFSRFFKMSCFVFVGFVVDTTTSSFVHRASSSAAAHASSSSSSSSSSFRSTSFRSIQSIIALDIIASLLLLRRRPLDADHFSLSSFLSAERHFALKVRRLKVDTRVHFSACGADVDARHPF